MDKIEQILSQMTLEEKISFCSWNGGRFGKLERLGIEGLFPMDNARGLNDYQEETPEQRKTGFHATAYPPAAALGATWNKALVRQIGSCTAKDCKEGGTDILFRPGINIKRHPLCGRNFEYYAEDPVLAGELGAAYISGVQSEGISACVKHFTANSQEYERMTTNARIDERTLREIYLRAFEIAIKKSNPKTIMTCYNRVNGEWVNDSRHILQDVLQKEWGYRGLIISDCMALHHNKLSAHKNGLDVELSEDKSHDAVLLAAVKEGTFSEERLNEIVRKVLALYFSIYEIKDKKFVSPHDENHAWARKAAEESLCLVQNRSGILPLQAGSSKLAILGRLAKEPNYMGSGSGHMNARVLEIPADEIERLHGAENVLYADGYSLKPAAAENDDESEKLLNEAVAAAAQADMAVIFVGLPYPLETEGADRTSLRLPAAQDRLIKAVRKLGKKTILVVSCGSVLELAEYTEKTDAILLNYLGGEAAGSAIANVLFGRAEPGGRTMETYPLRLEDTPAYLNFPKSGQIMPDVLYAERIYVGYRWYEKRKIPVLFPFGYGLSYTEFEYGDFCLSSQETDENGSITARISVRNVGKRPGQEVVQLYVGKPKSALDRPVKELKAFQKIELSPQETATVEFKLDRSTFEVFSPMSSSWIVEDGRYDIFIGSSSRDIHAESSVVVAGIKNLCLYNKMTPVEWIFNAPNIDQAIEGLPEQTKRLFSPAARNQLSMMFALPCYKMTQPLLGMFPALFSEEELDLILKRLN